MPDGLMAGYDYDAKQPRPVKVSPTGALYMIETVDALDDIGDVNAPTPGDGQGLGYDDATGLWIPMTYLKNVVEDTTPQLGGELDAQLEKIVNLGAPAAANDAARKTDVDAKIGNVVEDTTPQLGGELDAQLEKIVNLGAPAAANDAARKTDVDAKIGNVVEDTTPQLGGDLDCQGKKLEDILGNRFKYATRLNISGGVITVTQALHQVDTEGGAASDDLDTINGSATVNMIVIKAYNGAHTVVVKHNTGNIWLQGKADISLDDLEDGLLLVWSGTKWFDIAAGGAAAVPTKIQDADGDTKVDVEESADEDIVRMDVAGVEAFKLSAAGILTLAKQSGARAYANTNQVIPSGGFVRMMVETETADKQNEFDNTTGSGTAEVGTSGTTLHDDGAFVGAAAGDWIWNTTDDTYTQIASVTSDDEVECNDAIFDVGETFTWYRCIFTVTENGDYDLVGAVCYALATADKRYFLRILKNAATTMTQVWLHSSIANSMAVTVIDIRDLVAGDKLEIQTYHDSGVDKQLQGGNAHLNYFAVYKRA